MSDSRALFQTPEQRETEIAAAEARGAAPAIERIAKKLKGRARELRMAGFGASAQELEDMADEILGGK